MNSGFRQSVWISTIGHWQHKLIGARVSPGIFILLRILKVLVSDQCFQISVLGKECFSSCLSGYLQQDVSTAWASRACV